MGKIIELIRRGSDLKKEVIESYEYNGYSDLEYVASRAEEFNKAALLVKSGDLYTYTVVDSEKKTPNEDKKFKKEEVEVCDKKYSPARQLKCGAAVGSVATVAVIIGLVAVLSGFICALWHFGYIAAYIGLGAIVGYVLNRSKVVDEKRSKVIRRKEVKKVAKKK